MWVNIQTLMRLLRNVYFFLWLCSPDSARATSWVLLPWVKILVSIGFRQKTNFTNEKLYLRIPTSVDAIIFTMQNGNYNAVLLTKIVLKDLTI